MNPRGSRSWLHCPEKSLARRARDSRTVHKKKSENLEAQRQVMLRFLLAKITLCCLPATSKWFILELRPEVGFAVV